MTVKKEDVTIRECREEEVQKIPEMSKKILKALEKKGNPDFFGGVDADEVKEAMESGRVLVSIYQEKIIGFALLQQIEMKDHILLNGYGVDPQYQKRGIAKLLLQEIKKYAFLQGFKYLTGTVHPDNRASICALSTISENWEEGPVATHQTRDGRKIPRIQFVITLKK